MQRQVAKIAIRGVSYSVVWTGGKVNPFGVYATKYDSNGGKHRVKLTEYGDLASCLEFIKSLI